MYNRLELWLINGGKRYVYFGVWIMIQVALFTIAYFQLQGNPVWSNMHKLLGTTFLTARASALALHVDTALVLYPVCRTTITWVRRTPLNRVIPFDHALLFHQIIGYSIVLFTFVHAASHYYNYYLVMKATGVSYWFLMFATGHGLTGNTMMAVILVMGYTAREKVRRRHFNWFWNLHHLFVVYFALFSIHGSFCLLKYNLPPYCVRGGSFWKFWVGSGVLYLFERLAREFRAERRSRAMKVQKVILHPSKVVEVQLRKPSGFNGLAGQYAFINCPAVSTQQWHPFTLTSAPEEDYVSMHIRVCGDWTTAFSEALGATPEHWSILPQVLVDGPFGSASEDVFDYEVTMLFCAGIGCTPFASVLKSIWYRLNYARDAARLRKVYFFWVQRDTKSFEWFQDLLKAIEEEEDARREAYEDIHAYSLKRATGDQMIEIHSYLTGKLSMMQLANVHLNKGDVDPITGLKSPTNFGRPNMDLIFRAVAHAHPCTNVGVFFCGPAALGSSIKSAAKKWTNDSPDGTKFYYNKENF
ncbi:hypothetical protein GQ54DRAFT_288119 [Martensiomyces pterosporus]|nr:hypothetical protein GQ54DRAFT_288119 [Martensiomyces pterosporus]